MPTKTKQNQELEATEVLDRIVRVVQRANEFVLGFVKCNHPKQQEEMRCALLARLEDKRILEIRLDKPIVSLLDELTPRLDVKNPPDAVFVYGLEKSINNMGEASPVLGRLNNDRDLLRKAVPAALLIWLPDFALDYVTRGAPDFWAWRSGVYEFPTRMDLWTSDAGFALTATRSSLRSLPMNDKKLEIARLEDLLRTARELPRKDKREQTTIANLLKQVAGLYQDFSEWELAKSRLDESLEIARRIGNTVSVCRALNSLADVEYEFGNLSSTTLLCNESLRLSEDRRYDKEAAYSKLIVARIETRNGRFLAADHLLIEVLARLREIDDKDGICTALWHLGDLHYKQYNFVRAARYYEEGLSISSCVGDEYGKSYFLFSLGNIQLLRGDRLKAMELYERAACLSQTLGQKSVAACSLLNIADIRRSQGGTRLALRDYLTSWQLYRELGVAAWTSNVAQRIKSVGSEIGKKQFGVWIKEDNISQSREILKALDEEYAVIT